MPDRRPSTYKEEVLRYLHGMPRSQVQDNRLGVTRVLHERLSSRYPLTLGTISGILNALAQEHRVALEFGHRSLDNRHLITKVTVLAEPMQGVTLAPDEPPEPRGPNRPSPDLPLLDPAVLVRMVRQLVQKRLRDELVPLDTLQQVAAHVEHLVEELALYEQLIQEADEELMAKQAEWEQHEHEWVQLAEDSEAEAAEKVQRAERAAEQLRTRSNRHFARIQELTSQLQRVQAEENATQAELDEYRQRVSDLSKQLEQASRGLTESHHQILETQARAEAARDHYHRVVQIARLRERHIAAESMRWAQLANNLLLVTGHLHPQDVFVDSKFVGTVEQNPPDSWARYLRLLGDWVKEAEETSRPLLQIVDSASNNDWMTTRAADELLVSTRSRSLAIRCMWRS